jgi:hypothetical protein
VLPGTEDPVMAERRSRRRRAVVAGLIATVLLGGGMACTASHSAQPRDRAPAVQQQANSTP